MSNLKYEVEQFFVCVCARLNGVQNREGISEISLGVSISFPVNSFRSSILVHVRAWRCC